MGLQGASKLGYALQPCFVVAVDVPIAKFFPCVFGGVCVVCVSLVCVNAL